MKQSLFTITDRNKLRHTFYCYSLNNPNNLYGMDIWYDLSTLTHYLYNFSSWWTYDLEKDRYIFITEGSICSILYFRYYVKNILKLSISDY